MFILLGGFRKYVPGPLVGRDKEAEVEQTIA